MTLLLKANSDYEKKKNLCTYWLSKLSPCWANIEAGAVGEGVADSLCLKGLLLGGVAGEVAGALLHNYYVFNSLIYIEFY